VTPTILGSSERAQEGQDRRAHAPPVAVGEELDAGSRCHPGPGHFSSGGVGGAARRRMNAATVAASVENSLVVPNSMSQPWPAVAGSTITRLAGDRARRASVRMSAGVT
jgi:hypothetical protein